MHKWYLLNADALRWCFCMYFVTNEYIIAKVCLLYEYIAPREKFALAIAAMEAREDNEAVLPKKSEENFPKNYIPSPNYPFRWRQRHFQTFKNLKWLIYFCFLERGSKARKGRSWEKEMVTHSRKRGLLNDSEANPRSCATSKGYTRKMRSGFKRTSFQSH